MQVDIQLVYSGIDKLFVKIFLNDLVYYYYFSRIFILVFLNFRMIQKLLL